MKKCSTLKLLLAAISLFLSVSLQAQEMSPVTIRVETAGTLSTLIPAKDKYLITDLTLSGNLNGTDILYIREMAGGGLWKDSKTEGKLKNLDLANANIVSGGDAYYKYYYDYDEYDRDSIDNYGINTSETISDCISEYMFYNLSNLNSIILPQNITSIGDAAFADCTGLTSLEIPDKVTYIWWNAFAGCKGLKTIIIPNSVIYLGSSAFRNCASLTSITIPLGLKTLYSDIFEGCTGLKEFIVSENDTKFTTVEGVLFNKDKSEILAYPNAKSSTYIIPNSVDSIGEEAFAYCSNLASVTIPNSVKKIASGAFVYCTNLTSVTIPASVTAMEDENSFCGCTALKEFIVSDDNPNYKTIDGVLFSKDGTKIIAYPDVKSSEYTIPNGVEKISPYAFALCPTLTSVTIPTSVKIVGEFAFGLSQKLTLVNMGNGVTDIFEGAFWRCTALKSINVPNSVSIIYPMAFSDCKSLTSVFLGNSIKYIGDYAFLGCSALKDIHCKKTTPSEIIPFIEDNENPYAFGYVDKTSCKLYVPKGSYSAYKSAKWWNEFNIIIEEESTGISEEETNNVSVYTESGNIVIKNAEPGKIVSVYNTLGALIQTLKVADNELRINLPINLIYFIRIEDKRFKVAL
nr:leucine-rich repeat domain-containing protein [uncultured Bacteroides sp.]